MEPGLGLAQLSSGLCVCGVGSVRELRGHPGLAGHSGVCNISRATLTSGRGCSCTSQCVQVGGPAPRFPGGGLWMRFLRLLPQTTTSWGLRTAQTCSPAILEAERTRSGHSGVLQARGETRSRGSVLAPGECYSPWHSLLCGPITSISASTFTWLLLRARVSSLLTRSHRI